MGGHCYGNRTRPWLYLIKFQAEAKAIEKLKKKNVFQMFTFYSLFFRVWMRQLGGRWEWSWDVEGGGGRGGEGTTPSCRRGEGG